MTTLYLENNEHNTLTTADGVKILAPSYLVRKNLKDETQVVVSALVNSKYIDNNFNTIRLTSRLGTPLKYEVLSGNNAISNFSVGSIVTFFS